MLFKKLKKNFLNEFVITIIIGDEEYTNQRIFIEYYVDNKKKYFYKISLDINDDDLSELKKLKNYFSNEYVEGVKGFGKHIISNKIYHMVYHEKKNLLEFLTFDNTLFMNGKLI